MNALETLLKTADETEFFVVLFGVLRRMSRLEFNIKSSLYEGETALILPFRRMVPIQLHGFNTARDENTDTFILTQSGRLIWIINSEPIQTLVGLTTIQEHLWSQFAFHQLSDQPEVHRHNTSV